MNKGDRYEDNSGITKFHQKFGYVGLRSIKEEKPAELPPEGSGTQQSKGYIQQGLPVLDKNEDPQNPGNQRTQ